MFKLKEQGLAAGVNPPLPAGLVLPNSVEKWRHPKEVFSLTRAPPSFLQDSLSEMDAYVYNLDGILGWMLYPWICIVCMPARKCSCEKEWQCRQHDHKVSPIYFQCWRLWQLFLPLFCSLWQKKIPSMSALCSLFLSSAWVKTFFAKKRYQLFFLVRFPSFFCCCEINVLAAVLRVVPFFFTRKSSSGDFLLFLSIFFSYTFWVHPFSPSLKIITTYLDVHPLCLVHTWRE